MTPAQRKGLRLASRKGGVHVGTAMVDGLPPPDKKVTKPVAALLVAEGWARQDRARLNILPAGRAALARPQPHVPIYFRDDGHGLTTRRSLSVRDEGEVLTSTPVWDREAEMQRLESQDRRQRARAARDRAGRAA